MEMISFVATNIVPILNGVTAVIVGLIMIALVIPGEQPDKALQAALDFLTKFSRK